MHPTQELGYKEGGRTCSFGQPVSCLKNAPQHAYASMAATTLQREYVGGSPVWE